MTRRDYVAIAEVIRDTVPMIARVHLVERLVPILKADNRNFSADRFAAACGTDTSWGY